MELTQEIQAAARHLGQCIRQDDYIRKYLDALEESQTNPEASALEKKMYDEYEASPTQPEAIDSGALNESWNMNRNETSLPNLSLP